MSESLTKLKELTKQLNEKDKISDIKNKIASIDPNGEMYNEVLKIVLECTKSEYGVFGYINEDGAFVCPSLTKDVWKQCQVADKEPVFLPEEWGDSIWGRSIRKKKTLYANEPFSVPDGHIPINRALMVPIIYRKNVIGLFEVANKETDYDGKDIDILEIIADQVAPILNLRLKLQRTEKLLNGTG